MAKQNAINRATGSLTVDPGASGDSFVQFDINATGEFRIGVDDTDDSFRVSQGSALGTNDTFVVSSDGERTMPLQPAVLAGAPARVSSITGDGTVYTRAFTSETFDQGSDFSTPNFTAPITGAYVFNDNSNYIANPSGGGTNYYNTVVTSNRTYYFIALPMRDRITNFMSINGYLSVGCQALADMDAADTAYYTVCASGGAKTSDAVKQYFNVLLAG